MLEEEPQSVLQYQFMIPESASGLIDCTASGIFSLMDYTKLYEVSMTELEIGFRKIKEALDRRNRNYKVFIFEIEPSDLAT